MQVYSFNFPDGVIAKILEDKYDQMLFTKNGVSLVPYVTCTELMTFSISQKWSAGPVIFFAWVGGGGGGGGGEAALPAPLLRRLRCCTEMGRKGQHTTLVVCSLGVASAGFLGASLNNSKRCVQALSSD